LRGAVEREFGRQKHEGGLLPLRSAALSGSGCTLTILTRLATALDRARAVPLAA